MGKLFKIAVGLILIGFGVFAVFSLMSDEPLWRSINEEDYTLQELVYEVGDFEGLDFTFENRDYIVRNSTDDKIKITYYESEDDKVNLMDDESKLKLTNEVDWFKKWFSGLTVLTNPEIYDVYVYLPSDTFYSLNLVTSNGKLDIVDFSNLADVYFDTSNGQILLENVTMSSLNAETSNGSIRVVNVDVTGPINLNTSNGAITLTDITATGKLYFKTSNGSLTLNNLTAPSIEGKTSNTGIDATNLISDDIKLDTSNGSIDLTVVDDKDNYSVNMSTSNGDLYYDGVKVDQNTFNTSASKTIYLHSSNGSVRLDFDE